MRALRFALPLAMVASACSFTAFDAYGTDTPVTAITNKSFGTGVAIAVDRSGAAIVGVIGEPGEGARFYSIGDGRSEPSGSPILNGAVCELTLDQVIAGKPCITAPRPSAAGVLNDGMKDHPGCFALGYGKAGDSSALAAGPFVYCTDAYIFTLGAPADAPALTTPFVTPTVDSVGAVKLSLATVPSVAGSPNPPLLVGSEVDEKAWLYRSIAAGAAPVPLVGALGTKGDRFGAQVAIARTKDGPVYLVAAPAIGKVFAYVGGTGPADPPTHVGCIGGNPGLGDTMVTGDVDGDGEDDVIVRDGTQVRVFLGKDRPRTPVTMECGASWSASPYVFACEEARSVANCSDSDFGRSIAVGDLDGDGRPDVAVGAPYAMTDGISQSGAVLLFTPLASNAVADARYLGHPIANAAFGWAMAIGAVGGQDTLAVGARGAAKTYVQWCTGLPGSPGGPRCRK